MKTTRRLRIPALVVLMLTIAAGCGVRADELPRDIAEDQRGDLSDPGSVEDITPVGGRRIYLVSPDVTGTSSILRSVPRDVGSSPSQILSALLGGPTSTEQTNRLRTAIPPGTSLISTQFVAQGTLQVDLTSEIFEATGDTLIDAVAQIVFTSYEIDGVDRVQLRVDGQSQQWPKGDGALVAGPLTIYDYPGRAFSTQPDFPALPSPTN